jgi:phosphoadenosine phosphosulfate reductase
MYNYEWDIETGGYILTTKVSGVTKELRPVFYEELDLLGFNEYWSYPKSEKPLLWAETRRYIHKGRLVAEAQGGGLYTKPTLKIYEENLELEPVDVEVMVKKNKALMTGLVQNTVGIIYNTFNEYKSKNIDVTYVAFSGGKDSIVLLDLVQRALPHNEFKVVFSDTTMEISDTYKAVERAKQRWSDLEFYTAKSHLDAKESWELFGPPSRTQRWCCSVHKSAPSLLKLKEITGKDKLKALVFDGIRAEESNTRAKYAVVSEGQKHSTQSNCSPILAWGTDELFLYIFEKDLMLNKAYRYGAFRVGCAICPMSSQWWEYIANRVFAGDISSFIDIVRDNATNKFKREKELNKYLDTGGWKGRMGGRDLKNGGNKVVEQLSEDYLVLNIGERNSNWKEWIKPIGEVMVVDDNKYSIEHKGNSYNFEIEQKDAKFCVKIKNYARTKESIRFIYLFKNVFYKTAYCVNCKVCMVECPIGALQMDDSGVHIGKNCMHCESCLNMQKGCLAAKSLSVTMGGNNMNLKGIHRYQHFGFRKVWLNYFIEEKDDFWKCGKLGKYQFDGFKVWLKEAELTKNNMFNDLAAKIEEIGIDDIKVWAIILNNIVYNSTIIKWYIKNIEYNMSYDTNTIVTLLGDEQSVSTRENAVTSLKETFRYSPIGTELGVGICELKGNSVMSITRSGWSNPDPLVILYSLYKFAEKSDGYYSFTLSYLCDDNIERTGISPTQIFGLDRETMKDKLLSLATDYKDFISVSFNKDLDNIDLKKDKTSLDVLGLF